MLKNLRLLLFIKELSCCCVKVKKSCHCSVDILHIFSNFYFILFKAPCNPTVDIVFMLDGQSSVSSRDFQKQKDFIRNILERHESPARAVQVNRGS